MFLETMELALREGCGKTLAEAVSSPAYDAAWREQRRVAERDDGSDEHIAYHAGHLAMGRLLQECPEREAIARAFAMAAQEPLSPDVRTLILTLGSLLIDAAADCLPNETDAWAREWPATDADGRTAICSKLYEVLQSDWQAGFTRDEESFEKHAYSWLRDRLYDTPDRVLPRRFGKWKTEGSVDPNCVGKAQMLLGFARRAGARAYCVTPIRNMTYLDRLLSMELKGVIRQDIGGRNLRADKSLLKSLDVDDRYDEADHREEGFHVGVALEIAEGRFVLVDPHSLCWGPFAPEWEFREADRLHRKYAAALPGLAITIHDHGRWESWRARWLDEARRLFALSRGLQERLDAVREIPGAMMAAYAESPYMEYVLGDLDIPAEAKALISEDILRTAVMFGVEDPFAGFRFLEDPTFREEKIGSWLTYAHYSVITRYGNAFRADRDEGLLLHPAFDVEHGAWHMGLEVMNWLTLNKKGGLTPLFLKASTSQLYLRNAIVAYLKHEPGVTHELAAAAAATLRAQPFLHESCGQMLRRAGF